MRITIVMGFFLPVPALAGGATEKIWHRLGKLMADAGHHVTIISRRWPSLPEHETQGRLTHLRLRGFRHTRWLPLNLLLDFFWGIRVLCALPPGDVVVCNTVSLPIYLRRLKPSAGQLAVMLGRMPKGQLRCYPPPARLLVASQAVTNAVAREKPAFLPLIRRIGCPIDWSALAASRLDTASPLLIGFIGRIHREKGLHLMVRALALLTRENLPPWRAIVCGPHTIQQGGSGADYLAELRSSAPAGLVDFLPPQFNPPELQALYRRFDLFCYPSLADHGETFGVAVAEAMAARAAPVVSNLECFQDFVQPGVTGLIFDHHATDAIERLAANLRQLILDAPMRARIAQAAQDRVRLYDYPTYAGSLLADFATFAADASPHH